MAALGKTVDSGSGASGDYVSLNAAEAANGQDLTDGGGDTFTFTPTTTGDNAADTTVVDFDGWTTGATTYIKVTSASGDRASTSWDATKYRYSISDANAILVREDYIWWDGIQTELIGQSAARDFFQNVGRSSGWIRLTNSVFRGDGGAQRLRLYTESTGIFTDLVMWNCVFYDWGSHGDSYLQLSGGNTTTIDSSTFIWPGTTVAGVRNDGATSVTCRNVYSGGNTSGREFFGTISKTTCVSSDTTGDIDNVAVSTANFVDVTIDGGEDWALPSGSGLIDVGTDDPSGLGYGDPDIDGTARGATWDVGAFEFVAAGGGVNVVPLLRHRRQTAMR